MIGDNLFSLPVENWISYKEDSVAALRVFRDHKVQGILTLALEEARIERLMT